MPTFPTLHHVNLKTSRMKEMIDWYGKVAGLKVTHEGRQGQGAWLTNDEANHRLALLSVPGLKDDPERESRVGMHHSAYEFATFNELMDNFGRLQAMGIVPDFCLDHGMTTSMYYKDPDSNYVELQSDNFGGDWSKSKTYMESSPDFAQNPIGEFFDPAKVYTDYKTGKSFDELHKGMMSGKYQPKPLPSIGVHAEAHAAGG